MRPRVYLSGGMEYAPNEGKDWRAPLHDWLEKELSCQVFNPNHESEKLLQKTSPDIDIRSLKHVNIDAYRKIVSQLVDLDCREIAEHSTFLICYWDESAMRGAGTKGELTMARYFGKPVYVVTSVPHDAIPGWILACATEFFPDFEALKQFLLQRHAKPSSG